MSENEVDVSKITEPTRLTGKIKKLHLKRNKKTLS
jgi:hypothetical protein